MPDEFITQSEARRRYPTLSPSALYYRVVLRKVRTDLQPGSPPRYNAADLAAVMTASGDRPTGRPSVA
jgi:hypothetical protein